ncbi:MAG: HAD-IIA family hydrolase [Acidimicrobiia bacterium]
MTPQTPRPAYRGFIFDLDGTLYRGERAVPGATEALAALRQRGLGTVFVSNNPLEPGEAYAAKLTGLGIPTRADEVVTSAGVLAAHLGQHFPGATLFLIGEAPLGELMERAGFRLTDRPEEVDVVVAALDRAFDYDKWNIAFQAIRRGARFVATNADRTLPIEGGEVPDCAGIIAALESSTGRRVELVAGKPSKLIAEAALRRLGLPPSEVLVVGDRLETDILMGLQAGTGTALVLTGATTRAELGASEIRPGHVLETVGEVVRLAAS